MVAFRSGPRPSRESLKNTRYEARKSKTKIKPTPAENMQGEQKLKKKQFQTYKDERDTQFKKGKRITKTYEKASPKIKSDLKNRFKNPFGTGRIISSARRDTAKVQNKAKRGPEKLKKRIPLRPEGMTPMAKGGRAGFKMGSKCKLATKGKGRAYGKNS